eukprot:11212261-Lingulodinium_polyedra.AAC.1
MVTVQAAEKAARAFAKPPPWRGVASRRKGRVGVTTFLGGQFEDVFCAARRLLYMDWVIAHNVT